MFFQDEFSLSKNLTYKVQILKWNLLRLLPGVVITLVRWDLHMRNMISSTASHKVLVLMFELLRFHVEINIPLLLQMNVKSLLLEVTLKEDWELVIGVYRM